MQHFLDPFKRDPHVKWKISTSKFIIFFSKYAMLVFRRVRKSSKIKGYTQNDVKILLMAEILHQFIGSLSHYL